MTFTEAYWGSRWSNAIRLWAGATVLLAVALPSVWIASASLFSGTADLINLFDGPFLGALKRSLWLLACVAGIALALGWPLGTVAGLVKFPLKRLGLLCLAIPLFTPTFLWAIGLSSFRAYLPYRHQSWFDGFSGCVLTSLVQVVPFVVLLTILALRTVSGSQADVACLAGGKRGLLRHAARFAFPVSLCAAFLAGLMTLTDPGAAQIMGYHGIASEILIAFASRHDPHLAARKALAATLVILPFMTVLCWPIAKWAEGQVLGRELRRAEPLDPGRWGWLWWLACVLSIGCLVCPALAGLLRPLRLHFDEPLAYSLKVLRETGLTTLFYGLTAAGMATALGAGAGLACRTRTSRLLLLLIALLFFAVPPSLTALGVLFISSKSPPAFDGVSRSGWAVGLACGLRFIPLAAVLCLYARSKLPVSQVHAAIMHRTPAASYFLQVLLPWLRPALMMAALLVALLSVADVSTTLLLQPPGETTYTGRIFGVLDNTTERVLAALCAVYLVAGAMSIGLVLILERFTRFRHHDT